LKLVGLIRDVCPVLASKAGLGQMPLMSLIYFHGCNLGCKWKFFRRCLLSLLCCGQVLILRVLEAKAVPHTPRVLATGDLDGFGSYMAIQPFGSHLTQEDPAEVIAQVTHAADWIRPCYLVAAIPNFEVRSAIVVV
jgi:hypothetical protein